MAASGGRGEMFVVAQSLDIGLILSEFTRCECETCYISSPSPPPPDISTYVVRLAQPPPFLLISPSFSLCHDKTLMTCITGPGKMLLCMDILKNMVIAGSKEGNLLRAWGFPPELKTIVKKAKHGKIGQ
uniref:Uncharacterized protein n=1 Tax=Timema bartmani TaxID=61472 RepID=A0A7R9I4E0_9NEOP|nr:unnamed protein product [Timema bartmani]